MTSVKGPISVHPLLIVVFAVLLITGCSQTPQLSQTNPTTSTTDLVPPPEKWRIKAKLGIQTAEESGSVTLDWQQTESSYSIKVQGPLGQGNAIINGNDTHITIEQPGKLPLYSTNAAELIEETFGWALPITDFKFWVRGIANPELPVEAADYSSTGTLNFLQQSQWTLDYSRYKAVSTWQLPGRIKAAQNDSQLTLIIREWQLL